MTTWVVDASTLVAAVIEEAASAAVDRLFAAEHRVVAPMTAVPECANAVLKKVRHEHFPADKGLDAIRELAKLPVEYIGIYGFNMVSLYESARSGGVTAHDCVYLMLAEEHDTRVLTADRKLCRAVIKNERWAHRVIAIQDWRDR